MNKIFLTFDEQIELLKKRNLSFNYNRKNISNKFKWYLEKYNYHNFINGYNDPFMWNFDRNTNLYRDNINAQYIINLFNFDRYLSTIFIGDILNIERNFSTQICYHILRKHKDQFKEVNEGKILKLSDDEFLKIFPKINEIDDKLLIIENIRELKNIMIRFSRNQKPVFKYSDGSEYPLWVLSIYWSFGDACKIFNYLSDELKKKIISGYFGNSSNKFLEQNINF